MEVFLSIGVEALRSISKHAGSRACLIHLLSPLYLGQEILLVSDEVMMRARGVREHTAATSMKIRNPDPALAVPGNNSF